MLNDYEKDKLALIADDPVLLGALRTIFEEKVNFEDAVGKRVQNVVNDTELGSLVRSYHDATKMIRDAFREIESYSKKKAKEAEPRHAR